MFQSFTKCGLFSRFSWVCGNPVHTSCEVTAIWIKFHYRQPTHCVATLGSLIISSLPPDRHTALKIQTCELYHNNYMMASTQITNTEIFAFIAVLVLRYWVLFSLQTEKTTETVSRLVFKRIANFNGKPLNIFQLSIFLSSCCTLSMHHFFRIALALFFTVSFTCFLCAALFSTFTFFMLIFVTFFSYLHFYFHVALFWCCTPFMLLFFHIALFFHVTLFSFRFFPVTLFSFCFPCRNISILLILYCPIFMT